MRNKVGLAIAGLLAASGIFVGVALAGGLPGTAQAGDRQPPHVEQASGNMEPQATEETRQGMTQADGDTGDWTCCDGLEGMHQGMMQGDGHMGDWMGSGDLEGMHQGMMQGDGHMGDWMSSDDLE